VPDPITKVIVDAVEKRKAALERQLRIQAAARKLKEGTPGPTPSR